MTAVIDDVLLSLDKNEVSILICIDYSRAFDLLNHQILISILHFLGFSSSACNLLSSYLSDRSQQVKLDDTISTTLSLKQGVPQGSILGPLLYTLYTSNFHTYLSHCNYHLYADDTQIYYSFKISNLQEATNKINQDVCELVSLSNKHLLKINTNKSNILVFGNEAQRSKVISEMQIRIGNDLLNFSDCVKNLGLTIDHKLRFKKHITEKLSKAYQSLKLIYQQRYYLNRTCKKMLTDSIVLSHFNHCDIVYGACLDKSDIQRVQKVQNSCLRLIYGIRRPERISHKLKDADWLSMFNRRKLHSLCFYYNILKTKKPEYLHRKISFRTDVYNINLRKKWAINIPSHHKQLYKRSFSYQISTFSNLLDIPNYSLSLKEFKRKYKRIFLEQQ